MTFNFIKNVLQKGRSHKLELVDLPYGINKRNNNEKIC